MKPRHRERHRAPACLFLLTDEPKSPCPDGDQSEIRWRESCHQDVWRWKLWIFYRGWEMRGWADGQTGRLPCYVGRGKSDRPNVPTGLTKSTVEVAPEYANLTDHREFTRLIHSCSCFRAVLKLFERYCHTPGLFVCEFFSPCVLRVLVFPHVWLCYLVHGFLVNYPRLC